MSLMMNRRRRNQRGQSVVEGVLIMVVLISTIIAVMDFGQMMFLHQTLTERARGAARYGAINPGDLDGARNMVLFGRATVPDMSSRGFWGLTSSMVSVTRYNAGTNNDEVVVRISNYPFQFFSPWIAGSVRGKPITASASVEVL